MTVLASLDWPSGLKLLTTTNWAFVFLIEVEGQVADTAEEYEYQPVEVFLRTNVPLAVDTIAHVRHPLPPISGIGAFQSLWHRV